MTYIVSSGALNSTHSPLCVERDVFVKITHPTCRSGGHNNQPKFAAGINMQTSLSFLEPGTGPAEGLGSWWPSND